MKRIVLVLFLFFLFPFAVQAEEIKTFDSHITVQKDGKISIQENISYDFGPLDRHGIFRTIPTVRTNMDGKKFRLSLSNFSITSKTNAPSAYSVTSSVDENTYKIGSASQTISGEHSYELSYAFGGAITYFSDHDELYWNITGNGWNVPIGAVISTIDLPTEIQPSSIKTLCYTGAKNSTASYCTSTIKGSSVVTTTNAPLNAYEGLTVVVSFPKGVVAVLEPQEIGSLGLSPAVEKLIGILFVIFGILWYGMLPFYIVYRWFRFGRDPKPVGGKAHVWFSAPKNGNGELLLPGETGTLVDEQADREDVLSTVVDLARRGILKIYEKSKNTTRLTLLDSSKKLDETMKSKGNVVLETYAPHVQNHTLAPYEYELLSNIFLGTTTVDVKDIDVTVLSQAKNNLYARVVEQKLFDKNPNTTRLKYYAVGAFAFFTGNMPLFIICMIFGRAMPKKTPLGAQAAAQASGLKTFLTSQEKYLNWQGDKQLLFEKLLPYAIAMGVEAQWAKRFRDFSLKQPEWFQTYRHDPFTSIMLANALSHSVSSFASPPATSYRSTSGFSSGFSGGGFSGGGGGGGGGGSW